MKGSLPLETLFQPLPVIGVYETLPPGLNYQTWMLDETIAIERALRDHLSSFTLR
jgi:hypothetical protein